MKGKLTEFVEGLDMECERKKGIKEDIRIFGLNNRKNKAINSSSCLLQTTPEIVD